MGNLTGYAAVQLRGWRGEFERLDIQPAEIGGEIVHRHGAGHEVEDTLGNDAPRRASHIGSKRQRVSVSVQPQRAAEHAALRHTRIGPVNAGEVKRIEHQIRPHSNRVRPAIEAYRTPGDALGQTAVPVPDHPGEGNVAPRTV